MSCMFGVPLIKELLARDLSACSLTTHKSPSVPEMTLFGPGPGPRATGEGKSCHIVVRVDHQQGTWKARIPAFMGRGGRRSLCSGVNSCTPLQGLITQVSLEIPRRTDPWREGGLLGRGESGAMSSRVSRASANHHRHQRFYWKEFIWRVYQGCPSVYSLPAGRRLGGSRYRHAAVFKDAKVTAFMNFHSGATYCFHQWLYLRCPPSFLPNSLSLSWLFSSWFKHPPLFFFISFPLSLLKTGQKMNLCKTRTSYIFFFSSPCIAFSPRLLEYVKYIHVWSHPSVPAEEIIMKRQNQSPRPVGFLSICIRIPQDAFKCCRPLPLCVRDKSRCQHVIACRFFSFFFFFLLYVGATAEELWITAEMHPGRCEFRALARLLFFPFFSRGYDMIIHLC